jgi:hypothetical protein
MYCLPVNDLCHLEEAYQAKMEFVVRQSKFDSHSVSLGTFNGRAYSYNWYGETPFIMIYNLDEKSQFPTNTLDGK